MTKLFVQNICGRILFRRNSRPEVFSKKSCFEIFGKIDRGTPALLKVIHFKALLSLLLFFHPCPGGFYLVQERSTCLKESLLYKCAFYRQTYQSLTKNQFVTGFTIYPTAISTLQRRIQNPVKHLR